MNATEKVEMQVAEDADGSAVVKIEGDLPNNIEDSKDRSDDHDGDDAAHAEADEAEAQAGGRTEEEREAIRVARREERKLKKQIQKEKVRESNHLIDSLRRQNDAMAERLAALEKKSVGADLARMDKAIEDAHLKLKFAKIRIAEATDARDGARLAEAQDGWYEARRQVEALEGMKKRATTAPDNQAVPKAPDVRMQRKAAVWMERNSWYDPEGKDADSAVAVKIDEILSSEGWDPTTDDYWEELDERLTKYLPHRYNRGQSDRSSNNRTPRNIQTSSGREASSGTRANEYRLSPDRVRAIKEAGMWDDPTERQKMIRKYVEYDRNQRG
jgi:hypothetical protein